MSKKIYLFIALLFTMLVFGMIFAITQKINNDPRMQVATSIFPLYDIVKNVAGEEVKTVLILPPGASPHTFDPTPQEVKKIVGSKALFVVGYGVDDWTHSLAESAGISTKNIITTDRNITLLESVNHTKDPHYWLSVKNAILMASQIKDDLSILFPQKANQFENNFRNYQTRLTVLDAQISTLFSTLPDTRIATFHNAWNYFGRNYGLNIVTSFEEFPGEEPTADYLTQFQNKVRAEGIKVIFSEPQFSVIPLEPMVEDLNITISTLDPIGGTSASPSYEALMKFNADKIVEALQ